MVTVGLSELPNSPGSLFESLATCYDALWNCAAPSHTDTPPPHLLLLLGDALLCRGLPLGRVSSVPSGFLSLAPWRTVPSPARKLALLAAQTPPLTCAPPVNPGWSPRMAWRLTSTLSV